jgi:hypothetical protein
MLKKFLNSYKNYRKLNNFVQYFELSIFYLFLTVIQLILFEYVKDTTKNFKLFVIQAHTSLLYAFISTIATYGLFIGFFIIGFSLFKKRKTGRLK